MRYYDETIKRWKRVYHRGISEQIIFVTKETKNFCSMSSDHLWILEATFPHVSVLPWAIYPVT